jgi:hypothetical protein
VISSLTQNAHNPQKSIFSLKNSIRKFFSQLLDQRDRFDNISERQAFSEFLQVLIRRDGRQA